MTIIYHENFHKDVVLQRQRRHGGPSVLKGFVLVQQHWHWKVPVLCVQSDGSVQRTRLKRELHFPVSSAVNLLYFIKEHLLNINSDHVFSVWLLDRVVDGVAAHKCYVDVVSCYDVWIVVVYSVYEHDVRVIWCLRRERKMEKSVEKQSSMRWFSFSVFCPPIKT